MPSIFERFFGRREDKPPGGLIRPPPIEQPGAVEIFRPAGPPAAPGTNIFEILSPPAAAPGPRLPARAETVPFEILAPRAAPPPPTLPARRRETPVEAFFRRGPEAPPPAPMPPPPVVEEPGLLEAFLEPIEIERERRGIPSREYLDRILELGRVLGMIKAGRREPDFVREVRGTLRGAPPAVLPLVRIAEEERGAEDKVADFLGLPRTDIARLERAGRDPWVEILNPSLYSVERGLDWYLGDEVPGTFHFGVNDRGEFGLMYLEEHPEL